MKTVRVLSLLLVLLLGVGACSQADAPTPTATAVLHESSATETIPPVASPTIVIPDVSKEAVTAMPAATATTAVPATAVPVPATLPSAIPVNQQIMPQFAAYTPFRLEMDPPSLVTDPIAPDLGNVINYFALSPDQLARLSTNGVVVSPGTEKEFFTVYEKARYDNVPIFVTSDSLLHSYHLIFDKVLRTAERNAFIPMLQTLNAAMLAQAEAQYETLQGTDWEDAALRSVAFIAVGSQLLDADVSVPAYAQPLVTAELALIDDANGIQLSPIFPGLEYGEDYTQYIPRGHYTRSEELKAYFRSMMWYGRMTFRLETNDPAVGREETKAALLLVHALQNSKAGERPSLDVWLDLYNPTAFMVGRSDDLTAFQYIDVITAVYGQNPTLDQLIDEDKLDLFIATAKKLPPPRILGLVISETDDVEQVTKGFRLMGQRFVPDAYIFRELIWRNVGTTDQPRQLPSGLDVMAAMGSDRAYAILTDLGETAYLNYPAQMEKMQAWTSGLTEADWTETLYNGWLYTLHPLLAEPDASYPQFMQSLAWQDKQLNTSLGSWAELKHDTILYAKQVYAEMGGGGMVPPSPKNAIGYVEPVPEFYVRLSALATMTREGMGSRNLLSEKDAASLDRLIRLANAFQMIAGEQLRGEPLTSGELDLIRFFGGELEHLVMASGDTDDEDPFAQPFMDEEPQAAIIADVATAPDYNRDGTPDPTVLEVGVGRVDEVYVVVPVVDETGTVFLEVAKGGVFSYYEFPWPAADRLTDGTWREMLQEGNAPERPPWRDTFFTSETAYTEIQQAVYRFQESIPWGYWERLPQGNWTAEVTAVLQPDLDSLTTDEQYIGRQWINANYRSFDLQSPDLAVVTVRETWDDTLYTATSDYPEYNDPVLGHRGPYTLDVTYTLQKGENGWQVVRMVYANQPPAWEAAAPNG